MAIIPEYCPECGGYMDYHEEHEEIGPDSMVWIVTEEWECVECGYFFKPDPDYMTGEQRFEYPEDWEGEEAPPF